MAYSDYGGLAFRNRKLIDERSDWTLIPEGTRHGLAETTRQFVIAPDFHVWLGDGPIYVGLYKQANVSVYRGATQAKSYWDTAFYARLKERTPTSFEINEHRIDVFWRRTDNYYVFARLVQPDGTIWHGFSGYGVGSRFASGGRYSTAACVVDLFGLPWPLVRAEFHEPEE